jgi:hypothetical protein
MGRQCPGEEIVINKYKTSHKVFLLIVLLIGFCFSVGAEERPNILLIMTDQQTAMAVINTGNPYSMKEFKTINRENYLEFIQLVRKTPSLQGGDISTNLLFFNVFFDNIQCCTTT